MERALNIIAGVVLLAIVGGVINACEALFGREISEADFALVHFDGVVEQPNDRTREALLRVTNGSGSDITRIVFVCKYRSSPWAGADGTPRGVDEGWALAQYNSRKDGAIPPRATTDVYVTLRMMDTPYYEIIRCTPGKSIEQAVTAAGAPMDLSSGEINLSLVRTSHRRYEVWEPRVKVLGR